MPDPKDYVNELPTYDAKDFDKILIEINKL